MTVVSDSMLRSVHICHFRMDPLVYNIVEANVYPFTTYKEFKHQFVNLDLSKDKNEILRKNLNQESLIAAYEGDRIWREKNKTGGIGAPILTPREKEMLKLKEIVAREKTKNQVYKKYNAEIVRKVTPITSDDEMLEFMNFCNFSDDYILNTNAYDLMVIIARKYEEYRRLKEGRGSDKKESSPGEIVESLPVETC